MLKRPFFMSALLGVVGGCCGKPIVAKAKAGVGTNWVVGFWQKMTESPANAAPVAIKNAEVANA